MKRLIAYFVSGVRTGSFFYLALLLLGQLFPQLIYPKVNVGNILALFMMSGLMGMLSWILEELDRISYRLRIILHFLLTAIVLIGTCLISGWYEALTNPAIWIIFISVYSIIWLYLIWQMHMRTQRINQALLHHRSQKKKSKKL
ncbi:putative uncharacterized protein [Streptococcus salivarius CAG:79]|nr:putative uncharacterized protein [Streptococcus salivarius CAG:79]